TMSPAKHPGGVPFARSQRARPGPVGTIPFQRSLGCEVHLCKSLTHPFVALRVAQAYVRLFFVPVSKQGARIVSLASFDNYEIRLLELSTVDYGRDPPLWMELYDHDIPAAIDSCRCGDL